MSRVVCFVLFFFFVGVFLVVGVCSVGASSSLVEDSWSSGASMSQARSGLGVVAVDGKIYAIGGTTNGRSDKVVGTVEVYDPVFDSWTTLASMPTPRSHFAIAAYQNKIYCIGGCVGVTVDQWGLHSSAVISNVVEVYDTTTNTWTKGIARPPYGLANKQASVVNGQIFVQMGFHELFMFDPLTGVWTDKYLMPVTPQSSRSVASLDPVVFVVDDKLVFTGEFVSRDFPEGSNFYIYGSPEAMVLVYDPVFCVWSREVVGPLVLCDGVALVTSGVYAPQRVYFLGRAPGSTFGEVLTNQAYDFADNSWLLGEDMPNLRTDFGAAIVDDVLYVIGGYVSLEVAGRSSVVPVALVEAYVPFGFRSVPMVEVVSPLSEAVYNVSSVDLVFVVDRPANQLYYCVDGGANVTVVDYNVTLSGLSGGVYNVTVFAEDKYGNVGVSETVVFTVVSQPDPILSVFVVVVLCVVSVLVVAVLLLVLRRRRASKSLPMG
ncbi:MAG: hypothetical protein LBH79_00835 [Nitrososphaerota archaeon]|jgi:hypothetical protein|nr:hypothetical protein [Nitrososphaerota archaeon]